MTGSPVDTTTDLHAVIAALRAERDSALAREAALAEALTTRNSEFGERIEQQSATIDVLKVMSASPSDPLPVFDLIVNRARAFCEADGAMVALLEDGMLHLRTHIGATQAASAAYEAYFPCPVDDTTTLGRAVLTRAPVHNPDLLADPRYRMKAITTVNSVRSNAAVPNPAGWRADWRDRDRLVVGGGISDRATGVVENLLRAGGDRHHQRRDVSRAANPHKRSARVCSNSRRQPATC